MTEEAATVMASMEPGEPAQRTLALLRQWVEEDRTADPEAIQQAEQELREFEQALNAPRARAGSRLLYA